jgi:RimJ/RimL family protein N-acetyltransferase
MSKLPKTAKLKDGSSITIRQASSKDAAAVIEMIRNILSTSEFTLTQPDEFSYTEEEEAALLEKYKTIDGHLFLLAEYQGQLVGNLSFSNGNKRRNLHQGELAMGVRNSMRGKGVGTVLLETLMEWAEKHPLIRKVKLLVAIQNNDAIHLYRNLGFIQEGRLIKEIRMDDGEFMDVIAMYKLV